MINKKSLCKRFILTTLVLLLSTSILRSGFGQSVSTRAVALLKTPAGADAIKIPFESYKLPNGLTVILSAIYPKGHPYCAILIIRAMPGTFRQSRRKTWRGWRSSISTWAIWPS